MSISSGPIACGCRAVTPEKFAQHCMSTREPRMEQKTKINSVPADPTKGPKKSQHSITFHYVRKYKNITYNCCRWPGRGQLTCNRRREATVTILIRLRRAA